MATEYKKMSMLSLEAAQKFLANSPDATPGGLLEVAALIEGYLTGRFRVEYRSDFEPVKDGDDIFSLFSHVRAVVIDPDKPFESFVEKYDRLSEELKAIMNENHNLKTACSSLTEDTREFAQKEKVAVERSLRAEAVAERYRGVGGILLIIAVVLAVLVAICAGTLVWVLFSR